MQLRTKSEAEIYTHLLSLKSELIIGSLPQAAGSYGLGRSASLQFVGKLT